MSTDAPQNPDVPQETIEAWSKRYIRDEQMVSRGRNRRQKTRAEVKADVHAAFPALTVVQLLWWVWTIWRALRQQRDNQGA